MNAFTVLLGLPLVFGGQNQHLKMPNVKMPAAVLATASMVRGEVPGFDDFSSSKTQRERYSEAYHKAWVDLGAVAVFVGCPERSVKVPGVLACRFDGLLEHDPKLSWAKAPCILLLLAKDGKEPLHAVKALPSGATDLAVKWALEDQKDAWAGRGLSRQAIPFPQAGPFKQLLQAADMGELLVSRDVDGRAAVAAPEGWPEGVPFLEGLKPYRPARNTQRIATTNGAPTITPVPRAQVSTNRTDTKWLPGVPGGTDHLDRHEFRSTLFKLVPFDDQHTTGLQVWNGSNFQTELGWKRSYPDGTVFVDVLSNRLTGKPFEGRAREKVDGEWQSYVFFRDRQARPAGYNGLRQQCASCHNNEFDGPGSGGYALGMVPGSDTVVSDPFPALENR